MQTAQKGGDGTSRDLATIAGVVGGAPGNKIEKNSKKTISYDIGIRMNSDQNRKSLQGYNPSTARGDKVKIENGEILRM
jgi:outer membrane lipoprotein SlyB